MKRTLTFCFLFLALAATGQSYLGQSRQRVSKRLQHYLSQNQYSHSTVRSTDSSLVMEIEEPGIARVDFTYLFSEKGKCRTEIIESGCDSCFQKHVAYVLKDGSRTWKQLGDHTYISEYSRKVMMVLSQKEQQQRATIYRVNWNRKEYDELVSR